MYLLLNLRYFPVLANHLHRNWWHKRKKKIISHISFSFQFILTYQPAESGECWWNVCVSQSEMKTTELVLHRVFSILEKMKNICMCKLWNINDIILMNPPVSQMCPCLHWNPTLGNIKMKLKFTNKIFILTFLSMTSNSKLKKWEVKKETVE